MKFGLSASEYQFIEENVVLPLEQLGATVWCYGSRARGDQTKFSDLDIMIESDSDLSKSISIILEKLQDSNFPYKVDLVQLREFAESYKPGYEQDRINFTCSPPAP